MQKKILNLIPYLAGLNGINYFIFNVNVRFDQLIIVILLIVFIINSFVKNSKIKLNNKLMLLILFFLSLLFSSFFISPNYSYSVMHTFNLLSSASIIFLLYNYLTDKKSINIFLKNYFYAGFIFSTYGIIIFLLAQSGSNIYGVNLNENFDTAYGVFATMREPNVFGSYCMIYFIVTFVILLVKDNIFVENRKIISLLFITSGIGVLLSFTRGVWLAVLIVIPISFLVKRYYFKKANLKSRLFSISAILIFPLLIYYLISSFVSQYLFIYKILYLFDSKGGTGAYRINNWTVAIDEFLKNPIFGLGTFSFAVLHPITRLEGGNIGVAWIGNYLIAFLHDGGIVATSIFMYCIFSILNNSFKLIKKLKNNNYQYGSVLYALCFAIAGMLIAFLFTSAFSYSYSWMPIGLAIVYYRTMELERMRIGS